MLYQLVLYLLSWHLIVFKNIRDAPSTEKAQYQVLSRSGKAFLLVLTVVQPANNHSAIHFRKVTSEKYLCYL